jgi:hypothetical protein
MEGILEIEQDWWSPQLMGNVNGGEQAPSDPLVSPIHNDEVQCGMGMFNELFVLAGGLLFIIVGLRSRGKRSDRALLAILGIFSVLLAGLALATNSITDQTAMILVGLVLSLIIGCALGVAISLAVTGGAWRLMRRHLSPPKRE